MKQKRIESQTTQILYQHPTEEEQRVSRAEIFKENVKDFGRFIVLATVLWFIVTCFIQWIFGG